MYFTCIIRGSSLIKLGSLQDNRNYITEIIKFRGYYGFGLDAAAASAAKRHICQPHL